MTQRFHIPVVVTGDDDLTREQAEVYVDAAVSDIIDGEVIYRTFVESHGMPEEDAERLFTVLEKTSPETLDSAIDSLDTISDNE
jgi:hypothetical protein